MKAFVINPGVANSGRLVEMPEPAPAADEALVEVLEVGACGTDRDLLEGKYGEAPPGSNTLTIGHESLGRVIRGCGGLNARDLVVAMVRRPDPEPCIACAAGESDMCLNGRYTERGIKGANGYLAERYAEQPRFLVRVPEALRDAAVLLEPLSIVEKGLDQIHRIQARTVWAPQRALVLGSGTIGSLAALLLRLEGLTVHVYSRGDGGAGRRVIEAAGATFISANDYHVDHELAEAIGPADVVVEATGYSPFAFDAMHVVGPNGAVCLMGVTTGSRKLPVDASHLNLELVLENKVVFGTVNANRRHFESGVAHLQAIEARWPGLLASMVTRRIPLEQLRAEELEETGQLKTAITVAPRTG